MSHREELLEQLKKIRLEWFRSAANLDNMIQAIERELGDKSESEDAKRMFIRSQSNWRTDCALYNDWDELFKLEHVVWQQLCETKEES